MDKLLHPDKLGTDPNSSNAAIEWFYWKFTVEHILSGIKDINDKVKFALLVKSM